MKAVVYKNYGSPSQLQLQEVEKPTPSENEVLIKVHAVSLNASDNEMLTGKPAYVRMWGIRKPRFQILASDIAGEVVSVGKNVSKFKAGDAVFGDNFESWGGLAEYVCMKEDTLVLKSKELTFEETASIPQAATIALQGLRDKGKIQKGEKVLIVGAGGGAGTFAIQLAKHFGAEITAVDNTKKLEMMQKLGANLVIDYTQKNYTASNKRYDLILDFVAPFSIFKNKSVLTKKGRYVMVGGSIPRLLQVLFFGSLVSLIGTQKMGILAHQQNTDDIDYILELLKEGKIRPIIDKVFPLTKAAETFRLLGDGQARGKVVINLNS